MRLGKAGRCFRSIGGSRLELLFGKIVIGNARRVALDKPSLARFGRRGVLQLRLGIAQIGLRALDRELQTERIDLRKDIALVDQVANIDLARHHPSERPERQVGLDAGSHHAGQAWHFAPVQPQP